MPKSDTWPGDVPVEAFSNMDSAGSSDSVISMNSGYSEDGMEYLSAEERACLMYLEETIEALEVQEVQEDSGLSNDESHHESLAKKMDHMRGNSISTLMPDGSSGNQKSLLSGEVPTAPPASTALAANGKTQHYALNQTSEPQHSPLIPESGQNQVSDLATGKGAHPENVTRTILCPGPFTEASEVDLDLIPPPLDFRDKPASPSQPDKVNSLPSSMGISRKKPGTTFDLEQIRQRASVKKTLTSPVTNGAPSKSRPDVSPVVVTSSQVVASSPETAEPKSPPAVAPKPKKLPHNIMIKSHKRANSDGIAEHPVLTSSERPFLDPHKVRMEALRKLGLLKSSEEVPGPAVSPKLPLKAKASWAASSPPISPAAPNEPPSTPRCSPLPASVTVQPLAPAAASALPSTTSTALPLQDHDIIAAPAAFSDPIKPSPSENELSVKYVTEATPLTTPALVKQLTPPKVKSVSLGRSDLGGSKYMAGQIFSEASQGISSDQGHSQQHNNRPRPTSLRSRKEFSSSQGEDLKAGPVITKDPASQKALPANTAFHHSRDNQKLPRSQGISVLICPRSENEENRREALKKLGLLRD